MLSNYTREFKYNFKLAYPVIIGMLGHTFVQFIDNIMVGQLGTAELAAVSLGNSFVFVAMSLGIGFSTAITPLIAEADGSGKTDRVGKIFIHGLILCVFLSLILSFSTLFSEPLLAKMGQPKDVVVLAQQYLFWVSLSLIPVIAFQGFRQFCDGLSYTQPAMYATLIGNLINVCLNYFLIFGYGGFPKMGVEGAAIGTLISRIIMFVLIALYVSSSQKFRVYLNNFFRFKISLKLFRKIISLGLPSALQMFFEVIFFTSAVWMSGLLGKNPQASNQIALNLSSMTYMIAFGLGVAAMIRVGNQKGKNDFVELRRIGFSCFFLVLILDLIFCLFFLTTHDLLPWLYLDGNNPLIFSDVIKVVELSSKLIIISAFFQVFDGIQAVVLGSLRGFQDVNLPTIIIFFSYGIIGFPISYLLGIELLYGVVGIWMGLLIGLATSSILLMIRFNYLSKKFILIFPKN
ncbi:MAG: MATE family efflux transporter [Flavobacteriaceae bacterium]|nr:MATE family efflux transporter [Flavobacteriaceae bacterium]